MPRLLLLEFRTKICAAAAAAEKLTTMKDKLFSGAKRKDNFKLKIVYHKKHASPRKVAEQSFVEIALNDLFSSYITSECFQFVFAMKNRTSCINKRKSKSHLHHQLALFPGDLVTTSSNQRQSIFTEYSMFPKSTSIYNRGKFASFCHGKLGPPDDKCDPFRLLILCMTFKVPQV